MNADAEKTRIRDVIKATYDRDLRSKTPSLPEGARRDVEQWLNRALVDFDVLLTHIAILQEHYGATFTLPRPRRDRWPDAPLSAPIPTEFAHADRLADETVATITDRGLVALEDPELAALILNPVALYDLFDVIDELVPEHWLPIMQSEAEKTALPLRIAERPGAKKTRSQLLSLWWPIAASLLIGIGLGMLLLRGNEKRSELVLLAMETRQTRGAAEPVVRARIATDRAGFVTFVFQTDVGGHVIIPGLGGDPIVVQNGEAVSPPLPPSVTRSQRLSGLAVVTATRADAQIRKALEGPESPGTKDLEALASYLRADLQTANVGSIAVGIYHSSPDNADK